MFSRQASKSLSALSMALRTALFTMLVSLLVLLQTQPLRAQEGSVPFTLDPPLPAPVLFVDGLSGGKVIARLDPRTLDVSPFIVTEAADRQFYRLTWSNKADR